MDDKDVILGDGTVVRLKDAVDAMIREVITALCNVNVGPVQKAMLCLMTHMTANWRAVYILDQHGADAEKKLLTRSLAILIRSMFDAYLQLAFIAKEDTEARAKLYTDYEAVELYRLADGTLKQDDDLSRTIAASPHRKDGQKRLKNRFDKVVAKYTSTKGIVRNQWYSQGNLGNIATDIGKSDEYFWYTKKFNSAVHAGPLSAMKGDPGIDFLLCAAVVMSRVARIVTEHHGLSVSTGSQSTIDACAVRSLTSAD